MVPPLWSRAARGSREGLEKVPAGEALGALLLPQSPGEAEVPLGLARLASGGGASMSVARDEQLRRGPPSGVGTIRGEDQSGQGMRWASGASHVVAKDARGIAGSCRGLHRPGMGEIGSGP